MQTGDALIGFSRRQVLGYRAWLRQNGHSVACLYGDLGPEVRRAEADRFRSGDATILVATDAIGMGLNLPIQRIIFSTDHKYDGHQDRLLTVSEWKQIGGRAGRRGFHASGKVCMLAGQSKVALKQALLDTTPALHHRLSIHPPFSVVQHLGAHFSLTRISDILKVMVRHMPPSKNWTWDSLRRLAHLPWIQQMSANLPLKLQFLYLGCPVRDSNQGRVLEWMRQHAQGQTILAPHIKNNPKFPKSEATLAIMESNSHLLVVYRWLARHFPETYTDGTLVQEQHAELQLMIAHALAQKELGRICASCGNPLKMDSTHKHCDACWRAQHTSRYDKDEWF